MPPVRSFARESWSRTTPWPSSILAWPCTADLSGPERSRWHQRTARLLAEDEAPLEQIVSHLLESLPNRDAWTVTCLREGASQALARGAPEVAVEYLRRALADLPSTEVRAHVLFELGRANLVLDPSLAIEDLKDALAAAAGVGPAAGRGGAGAG